MHFPSPWTDERCALAKQLWDSGSSATQIADALDCGLTRNAVCGKLHRMGRCKEPRPTTLGAKPARPKQRNKTIKYLTPARGNQMREEEAEFEREAVEMNTVADAYIPIEQRKTVLELKDEHCRWPVGDPGTPSFFFCGATRTPDKPYCATHCARAYAPAPRSTPRRVYPFTENSA